MSEPFIVFDIYKLVKCILLTVMSFIGKSKRISVCSVENGNYRIRIGLLH